ncbi:MAG TPA: type II toxin-antitoxin system RelE/ParE family toxin, partial [Burkholderiales bacterium]|nr:type II toxin-antitoxin system RelE/ParE family toxin [Burkholderiales bacterium]
EVAEKERDEAVSYYNNQVAGLGDAFLLEAVAAIERIRQFPDAWHPLGENVRRCRLRRFPYGLIYQADETGVLVVAVAHTHRRPEYWRDRLKGR